MLGSTRYAALLGSAPQPTAPEEVIRAYLHSLADAGFALFFTQPGAKLPLDLRTTVARNKDYAAAREAGAPQPDGLHMATSDRVRLTRWLKKYRADRSPEAPVSIAMEVGRSRLLIVDVDTPDELDAWREMWAAQEGDHRIKMAMPTVSSPGVRDSSGNWVHHGGGHFYFTLSESDAAQLDAVGTGALTLRPRGEDGPGVALYWRSRYVLLPPSERAEGAYRVSASEMPLPAWLLAMIVSRDEGRREARHEREQRREQLTRAGVIDPIDEWAAATGWDEVLAGSGWISSGLHDSCTCPVWTRPGQPVHRKSATMHEVGCTAGRYDELNPPAHIWSDAVDGPLGQWLTSRGTRTVSKLQLYAVLRYPDADDPVAAAVSQLSLAVSTEDDGAEHLSGAQLATSADVAVPDIEPAPPAPLPVAPSPAAEQPVETSADDPAPTPDAPLGHALDTSGRPFVTLTQDEADAATASSAAADDDPYKGLPKVYAFDALRDLEPPAYLIDGWLEDKGLLSIIGDPGVGKSNVAIDMMCSIAAGTPWQGRRTLAGPIIYVAGEGLPGVVSRVRAWEREHGTDVGSSVHIIGEAVLVATKNGQVWPWLTAITRKLGARLVIFDTLARMALGLEENSSSEMGHAVARFDRLRRDAECAVLAVHHTARGKITGRGSTAIQGALESEVLVLDASIGDEPVEPPERRNDVVKMLRLKTTKQKNAEDGTEMILSLRLSEDTTRRGERASVVVADADGEISDDPLAVVTALPMGRLKIVEDDVSLAVRMADRIVELEHEGATVTEIARRVRPLEGDPREGRQWSAALDTARNIGLDLGLIVHRTPTRYERGPVSADQALAARKAQDSDAAM